MELFDTHVVKFGQELLVSGLKTLGISQRSIQVIKSQPHLGSFQNTLSEMKKKNQIMNVHTKWNCLIPILSSLDKNYLFQA